MLSYVLEIDTRNRLDPCRKLQQHSLIGVRPKVRPKGHQNIVKVRSHFRSKRRWAQKVCPNVRPNVAPKSLWRKPLLLWGFQRHLRGLFLSALERFPELFWWPFGRAFGRTPFWYWNPGLRVHCFGELLGARLGVPTYITDAWYQTEYWNNYMLLLLFIIISSY